MSEAENIRKLTDYCLLHYHGEAAGEDGPQRLFDRVTREAARLAASYIAAGFVHGVLNTDNIAITAESFDYGPWRWTPYWDGAFTAAYFDHVGLYAFGRQPEAIHWNLLQLARSLLLISTPEALEPILNGFRPMFQGSLRNAICVRLGVAPKGEEEQDNALLAAIESGLSQKSVEIDRFFFDWRGGSRRAPSPADEHYESDAFAEFRRLIPDYEADASTDHPYWSRPDPVSMHIDEVEAIWARIDQEDDWSALYRKIQDIRAMGDAMAPKLDRTDEK